MNIHKKLTSIQTGSAGLISLFLIISTSFGNERLKTSTQITILHTNDLHSHFRETRTPVPLGGLARLKTAIDQVRGQKPEAFLVDGGDWSEGDIYYSEGAGAESLKMMDQMGYDVAVIGNHDWLNGPDVLLDSIKDSETHVSLVSSNLSTHGYGRAQEFHERILPYVIKKQGDVKIAFIGLSTFEFVFDHFFAPIKITEPFLSTRNLAAKLKSKGLADVVVVVSHNSVFINKAILKVASSVDLIIGAHDHKKLTQPEVVTHSNGKEAWVVETGSWGQYLGQVDLEIDDHKNVKLMSYHLTQMDSKIPEDPAILSRIENIENRIEARLGPVFTDQVGESEIQLERLGQNNGIGNLVADAYFHATGADFAMESTRFIYGELQPGIIRSVDVYNANSAVYNPKTGKTWSVQILPIRGRVLSWFLNILYASKKVSALDLLNVSGIHFVYDPIFAPSSNSSILENTQFSYDLREDWPDYLPGDPFIEFKGQFDLSPAFTSQSIPTVSNISIQGQPLDSNKIYRVATGGGLVESLRLYNKLSPFPISVEGLEDTGLENWRVLADYIHGNSPLTSNNVPVENRIQSLRPDLAIYYSDIQLHLLDQNRKEKSEKIPSRITVRIKNYGTWASGNNTAQVRLLLNKNGNDQSSDPNFLELGEAIRLQGLKPNEEQIVSWDVELTPQSVPYEITAKIEGNLKQVHTNNLAATRWFKF